jgi:hypothetical protein
MSACSTPTGAIPRPPAAAAGQNSNVPSDCDSSDEASQAPFGSASDADSEPSESAPEKQEEAEPMSASLEREQLNQTAAASLSQPSFLMATAVLQGISPARARLNALKQLCGFSSESDDEIDDAHAATGSEEQQA